MKRKCQKIPTVIGAFCLLTPNCLPWYWGNAYVYALSYNAMVVRTDDLSLEAPWIIPLFMISWIGSLLACGFLARHVDRRWLILAAIALSDSAMFTTCFTIQNSLVTMVLTLSVLHGIATGILYGNCIHLIVQCADKDVGIMTSVIQGAFPSGGTIITQLITWYTNPTNDIPNLDVGSTVYFTQKNILDKVPSMFLVLGGFSSALHILGLVLLQLNPVMRFKMWTVTETSEELPVSDEKYCIETEKNGIVRRTRQYQQDYTPKEVLKSPVFYCLWIMYFITDFPFILLTNYYKLYGQIWIHDDHFLTNVGTIFVFSSFCIRVAWGVAVDKFGLKNSFVYLLASLVFFSCWYYFTARIDRWLYLFATILYGGTSASLFGCYITAVAVIFGKTNVSTNFGLLMTSSIVFNALAPETIKAILVNFGWFVTFVSASMLNLFALILCITFIPKV